MIPFLLGAALIGKAGLDFLGTWSGIDEENDEIKYQQDKNSREKTYRNASNTLQKQSMLDSYARDSELSKLIGLQQRNFLIGEANNLMGNAFLDYSQSKQQAKQQYKNIAVSYEHQLAQDIGNMKTDREIYEGSSLNKAGAAGVKNTGTTQAVRSNQLGRIDQDINEKAFSADHQLRDTVFNTQMFQDEANQTFDNAVFSGGTMRDKAVQDYDNLMAEWKNKEDDMNGQFDQMNLQTTFLTKQIDYENARLQKMYESQDDGWEKAYKSIIGAGGSIVDAVSGIFGKSKER